MVEYVSHFHTMGGALPIVGLAGGKGRDTGELVEIDLARSGFGCAVGPGPHVPAKAHVSIECDRGLARFGIGTPLVFEGRNAPNGFVGLAQYDSRLLGGNDDGLITAADAIWPQLRIWLDADANGISSASEMRTLASFGITALETIPKHRNYVDRAGNYIPYWAWATQRGAKGHGAGRALMVDVFFLQLPH